MTNRIPTPLALGRFRQLPQRSNEVWQGGLVRMPMWIAQPSNPDGGPYRPIGAVWVSLRTGLVHLALPEEGETASPDLAFDALLEFGVKQSKYLGGRPARIEVVDQAVRDALASRLATLSTSVSVTGDLPAVREVMTQFEIDACGGRRNPGLLESAGVTIDRVRAFADAAAVFYSARIWRHLANDDLIVIEGDDLSQRMRHFCVLGQGGQQYGLSFFDSRAAFTRVLDLAGRRRMASHAHGVTFGAIDEIPFADSDAWLDHQLPVAGPGAYPLAADLHRNGTMQRPNARELTSAEALLRALAATTENEIDSGTWQKHVETFDGAVTMTLTLPAIVEWDGGKTPKSPTRAMARAAERASVRIGRLIESRSYDSIAEVNREIERAKQAGLFDEPTEAAGRELSPLERAQELACDAMEAAGRVRVALARQALAISQDCADAWVILAEAAPDPGTVLELYGHGVVAGARAIGPEFDTLAGEFWGHLETRPYMRARLGLARALEDLDREDEAITHYRELLRLNPNDNQGVRYLLIVLLLALDRDEGLETLFDQYADDIQAIWPYARALWCFRREGDTPTSRAALDEATRINRSAAKYLLDPDAVPFDRPPHFALGSKEEAAYIAGELGEPMRRLPVRSSGCALGVPVDRRRGDRPYAFGKTAADSSPQSRARNVVEVSSIQCRQRNHVEPAQSRRVTVSVR